MARQRQGSRPHHHQAPANVPTIEAPTQYAALAFTCLHGAMRCSGQRSFPDLPPNNHDQSALSHGRGRRAVWTYRRRSRAGESWMWGASSSTEQARRALDFKPPIRARPIRIFRLDGWLEHAERPPSPQNSSGNRAPSLFGTVRKVEIVRNSTLRWRLRHPSGYLRARRAHLGHRDSEAEGCMPSPTQRASQRYLTRKPTSAFTRERLRIYVFAGPNGADTNKWLLRLLT